MKPLARFVDTLFLFSIVFSNDSAKLTPKPAKKKPPTPLLLVEQCANCLFDLLHVLLSSSGGGNLGLLRADLGAAHTLSHLLLKEM